jgi:hypothetical protein
MSVWNSDTHIARNRALYSIASYMGISAIQTHLYSIASYTRVWNSDTHITAIEMIEYKGVRNSEARIARNGI